MSKVEYRPIRVTEHPELNNIARGRPHRRFKISERCECFISMAWRSAGGWREGQHGVLMQSCVLVQFRQGPAFLWHPGFGLEATTKAFASNPLPPFPQALEEIQNNLCEDFKYPQIMQVIELCMELWFACDATEFEIQAGTA